MEIAAAVWNRTFVICILTPFAVRVDTQSIFLLITKGELEPTHGRVIADKRI